jgi:transcriptional regulator with XRE-family HTH domain
MNDPASLLRRARRAAGLTQAELARRMGTTQSAIARMERPGANPSVAWLDRALEAAGRRLELASPKRRASGIDESLIRARLRLTPTERLASFEAGYAGVREIALAGTRARGELA